MRYPRFADDLNTSVHPAKHDAFPVCEFVEEQEDIDRRLLELDFWHRWLVHALESMTGCDDLMGEFGADDVLVDLDGRRIERKRTGVVWLV